MESLNDILRGLPSFLGYFASGIVLVVLFFVIYLWLTPQRELKLIRSGNSAASISLAGALLGFMLPLASVITHSAGIRDMALWGLIALIVQVVAFFIARALIPNLPHAIEEGRISVAAFGATISLTIGILNAACMTP
jgi:putative membrane protein